MLDWEAIDTVLLDMDGTLLDLAFDNYFWAELIPQEYARIQGMTVEEVRKALLPHFIEIKGSLDWYNIDYWTQYLGFDVGALKMQHRNRITYLPHSEYFLQRLNKIEKRVVIATNADPKAYLIKNIQTGVGQYVEQAISSHDLGHPKEQQQFWQVLQEQLEFDPQYTLFVDDSPRVLLAAFDYGIQHIAAIQKPDSSREGSTFTAEHAMAELPEAIYRVNSVMDLL